METILTSVKLLKSAYAEFKIDSIRTGMTLQKFVNCTLLQYNNDEKFHDEMLSYASGSSL